MSEDAEVVEDETLPEFWGLVLDTADASNDVDHFDVDDDPIRQARMEELEEAQDRAAERLIRFVKTHGDALLLALNEQTGTQNDFSAKSEDA
jgi:hypothetical protein